MFYRSVAVLMMMFMFAAVSQAQSDSEGKASAILAGGCFWCMESPYDKTDGVLNTTVGYSGGDEKQPTYSQVSSGQTGHIEVIKIDYDPEKLSFEKILQIFWRNIDPLDAKGQFCDKGAQYRSAIFYRNDKEKQVAEESRQKIKEKLGKNIATEVLPAKEFWKAEDYHQDYYQKNPIRYKLYRYGCRRDARLEEIWGEGK